MQSSAAMPALSVARASFARRWMRPEDLVWLALFTALAVLSPTRYPVEPVILASLAVLQLAEARIAGLRQLGPHLLAVSVKLLLVYLLMGFTGGIESSYYLLLLLPVVSTATVAGGIATSAITLLSGCAYLSFLLYVDWSRYAIPATQRREIALRLLLILAVAFLVWTLAEATRRHAGESQRLADRLAEANRDLEQAESDRRRSERLSAMGHLAAGLAHELRNPLSTARAASELLLRRSASAATQGEMAGFIKDEIDRANTLITRFLDFAHPLQPELEWLDLSDVVSRAMHAVQADAVTRGIPLVRNDSPDVPKVEADPHLLESVLVNLLRNAVEASEPGAAVILRTRLVDDRAEIAVIDRGSGIAPEHREEIFNPFFTTKAEGVGLGLAVVAKIVDAHGGSLDCDSESGRGSVFRVLLPLHRSPAIGESRKIA